MESPRAQFTIASLLWATLWVAVWMVILPITGNLPPYWPINVTYYASCLVPIAGWVGIWKQKPLSWGLLALVARLAIVIVIIPPLVGARE